MVGTLLRVILSRKVSFHTIDNLDIEFLCGLGRIRISLHHTMVGDGNSRPAPAVSRFNEVFYRYHSIHIAHGRMGMKFHTFDLGIILALLDFLLG